MRPKPIRIFVAGHNGMVGSALVRLLNSNSANEVITAERNELDLLNQSAVNAFFSKGLFDQVYLAAAKVGGIHANNTYPADFIYENLVIQTNVIHAAHMSGVQKLLFLGSSCIYPKYAEQPMNESALLTGTLESTNEPYAIAKIAGIKLCESYNRQYGRDYRSVMPTNLYGPGDNYHPENAHVIPALIRRFHEAKIKKLSEVAIWGTGTPKREFLYVGDMAQASVTIMNLSKEDFEVCTDKLYSYINVGSSIEVTIKKVAETIKEIVDYKGKIAFDKSMPDGCMRKFLDSDRLYSLGWKPATKLLEGLKITYEDFVSTVGKNISSVE